MFTELSSGIEINRLERILTMVYGVQNYKAYFGLYPLSAIYKTENSIYTRRWIKSKISLVVLYGIEIV
jgi:hypothetical protein